MKQAFGPEVKPSKYHVSTGPSAGIKMQSSGLGA
jgi:hypothetical protein